MAPACEPTRAGAGSVLRYVGLPDLVSYRARAVATTIDCIRTLNTSIKHCVSASNSLDLRKVRGGADLQQVVYLNIEHKHEL